jgi:hypothetical protein
MKHTVGMCGAGKFMHDWKERDPPNCPRCGCFEDAPHDVWTCKGTDSNKVWDKFLLSLFSWLEEAHTDPDLLNLLSENGRTLGNCLTDETVGHGLGFVRAA